MARSTWSYRLPPLAGAARGIEGYEAWDRDGESVGTVSALLLHGDERFVAIETGTPPLLVELYAVRLEDVQLDHAALAVRLPYRSSDLPREGLELDPDRAVRDGGEADAEPVELPVELVPAPTDPSQSAGPVDSARFPVALGLGVVASLALLGVVVAATAAGSSWWLLLAVVPGLLFLTSAIGMYRAYRRPYRSQGARHL